MSNALLQKIGAGSTPLGGKEVNLSSGIKFLRSQSIWNDGLRLDGVAYIKPETHAKMAGTAVLANDLLCNITGASIGRCTPVPADFDEANVSQHVTIIQPHPARPRSGQPEGAAAGPRSGHDPCTPGRPDAPDRQRAARKGRTGPVPPAGCAGIGIGKSRGGRHQGATSRVLPADRAAIP